VLKTSQVPGDANVVKRFFRDNFTIFRLRSKDLESVNFSVCLCKFSVFKMVTWPLLAPFRGL